MATNNQTPIVRICEVISIDDPMDGGRIKVRMVPEDSSKTTIDELDYCFPLLPKMFHVMPKVGEAVLVLTAIAENGFSQRYYIGPVISQLSHIGKDYYKYGAMNMLSGAWFNPDSAPSADPETNGAYPKKEDISILGRKNTDIQIKENDIRIRAGVKKSNPIERSVYKFNTKNPAYLKLKYHEDKDNDASSYQSTATLVADKINLIGNNSKEYFRTTDPDELISDNTMDDIIEKAHRLPYGDVLVEFLDRLRKELSTHTHPFPMLPPCSTATMNSLRAYELDNMLSESVRIN